MYLQLGGLGERIWGWGALGRRVDLVSVVRLDGSSVLFRRTVVPCTRDGGCGAGGLRYRGGMFTST